MQIMLICFKRWLFGTHHFLAPMLEGCATGRAGGGGAGAGEVSVRNPLLAGKVMVGPWSDLCVLEHSRSRVVRVLLGVDHGLSFAVFREI